MTQSKTILVVEDELQLQTVIKDKLQEKGFRTIGVRSIEEALSTLEESHKIHAIWLDHYLIGKEDGLTLVAKLKNNNSKYKSLPIYLISNTASQDKILTYQKLGVEKCYTKSDHTLNKIVEDIKKSLTK